MKDKVVIVTGASSGIGLATVKNLAGKGAKVVLAARSLEKIQAVAEELKQTGKDALAVQADVTDENSCKNLTDKTVTKFGQIDVLINNAGISMRALFADTEIDVIRKLMDINFWGMVYCTKFALPYL